MSNEHHHKKEKALPFSGTGQFTKHPKSIKPFYVKKGYYFVEKRLTPLCGCACPSACVACEIRTPMMIVNSNTTICLIRLL